MVLNHIVDIESSVPNLGRSDSDFTSWSSAGGRNDCWVSFYVLQANISSAAKTCLIPQQCKSIGSDLDLENMGPLLS